MKKVIMATMLIFMSLPIFAELKSDRPGLSEPPIVIDKGAFHFEYGFNWTRIDYTNKYDDLDYISTLFRYGLLEFAELRATFDFSGARYNQIKYDGISGVSIGTKVRFFERSGWMPETGIIAHFDLPVGSSKYRPEKVSPNLLLVFENSLSDDYIVNYNFGAALDDGDWGYNYSFSVEGEVFDDTEITLGYYSEVMSGMKPLILGEFAIAYFISESFGVDISGAISLKKSHDFAFVSIGFSTIITNIFK